MKKEKETKKTIEEILKSRIKGVEVFAKKPEEVQSDLWIEIPGSLPIPVKPDEKEEFLLSCFIYLRRLEEGWATLDYAIKVASEFIEVEDGFFYLYATNYRTRRISGAQLYQIELKLIYKFKKYEEV